MIDKLAWVRIENGAVLTARSRSRDRFYLPGGKREAGETDHAALAREIREELRVDLLPDTLQPVGEFVAQAHGQAAGTPVRMRCFAGDYTGQLTPAAEIEEIAWLTYADRGKVSEVTAHIFDFLRAEGLLREG
jgi:8-oxo-dGTP pyrophosphatase MutT (NUDIX family)